jgi:hypothetical protein
VERHRLARSFGNAKSFLTDMCYVESRLFDRCYRRHMTASCVGLWYLTAWCCGVPAATMRALEFVRREVVLLGTTVVSVAGVARVYAHRSTY